MAFCLKGILVLAVIFQPLKGVPVKRLWSKETDMVNKARDIVQLTAPSQANFLNRPVQTKRNPNSTFSFVNKSEIAKGLDYLKKKYPNVDWSFVTPLPTSSNAGKREFSEHKISLEQTKRFFVNDSEIAKGLDYLKKKYPNVDWSFVTPLPTFSPGKREFKDEIMESRITKTNSITGKRLDQQKKSLRILDSTIEQRNDIPEKRHDSEGISKQNDDLTSSFEFIDPEEEMEGLEYLKEKHPEVDWSTLIEEDQTLDV